MTDSRTNKAATFPVGDVRNEEPVVQQLEVPVILLPEAPASSVQGTQVNLRINPTENPHMSTTRPLMPGILESTSRLAGLGGVTNPLPIDHRPAAPDLLAGGPRPFGPIQPPNGPQLWKQPATQAFEYAYLHM